MPVISFTLTDAALAELVDALCFESGYTATLPDGVPNPLTRAQFARQEVRAWLVSRVKAYRKHQAALAAAATDPDIT